MFPETQTYKTFVEPFVGAGHILFRKPMYEHQREVINDLDNDVYLIFNGLKKAGSRVEKYKPIPYPTKEECKDLRQEKK